MLAERGVDVSYETNRRWFLKFGSVIAANLRRTRPGPGDHWHLDEMVVVIRRKRHWLLRAVSAPSTQQLAILSTTGVISSNERC